MLWEYLKQNMSKFSNQTIKENDTVLSYKEMIEQAEEFSFKIREAKCCAILCDSQLLAAKAILSCFAAGVTALPLSKRYGEEHYNKILNLIDPNAIITDTNGELIVKIKDNYSYKVPYIKPAVIMCTSGTSGTPKGAMLSEENILSNIKDISCYFKMDNKDTILIARPIYHSAVLTGEFLTSILKGVKIEFYSGDFNPSEILKLINQEKITAFCGTPTLLNMMSKFKRNEANTLKHICISGECMGEAIAKRISDTFKDANIYHVYGLTEASPRVAYLPPHMFSKYSDCVGIALKSVFFKVLNDAGEEVSKNSVGKLWVKGKNVMLGYYNDPVKTNEVIKNGWLNTGDLALINEKGLLKIMGRSDDLIIKAGMNIYPREVEDVLKKDGRVKEVVLSSERNEKLGVQLKLTVAGDFNNEKEIKQLCISSLPAYQIPSKIILVQEILKNGSGKIIRR